MTSRFVVEVTRELRELGDRDALVAHALDVDRAVEERENEAEVGRDGRLAGEHELDLVLDRHGSDRRSRRRTR